LFQLVVVVELLKLIACCDGSRIQHHID